ncbi:MAG: phosphoribosyltransferase family protein [Pyrinomonadaceae bacterium]
MAEIVEVHGAAAIAARVHDLAAEITRDYEGRELTVLGVLEDSFVFLSDLLRALRVPARTAFLRYDHQSRGGVQDISFSTKMDLSKLNILLVEAVLDTGVPQEYLMKQLESHGAASVKLCVLLDKPDRRRVGLEADWRGFQSRENFVFGYGLGFNDRWRELPYLATFEQANDR